MKELKKGLKKEFAVITSILEDNLKMSNVGYQLGELEYHYGNHVIDKGILTDMDGDKIVPGLLYQYNGNEEYYKVIEEDVEEFDKHFVVDTKYSDENKKNLVQEWTTLCATKEEALDEAYSQWAELSEYDKKYREISACFGSYDNYNPLKEYSN